MRTPKINDNYLFKWECGLILSTVIMPLMMVLILNSLEAPCPQRVQKEIDRSQWTKKIAAIVQKNRKDSVRMARSQRRAIEVQLRAENESILRLKEEIRKNKMDIEKYQTDLRKLVESNRLLESKLRVEQVAKLPHTFQNDPVVASLLRRTQISRQEFSEFLEKNEQLLSMQRSEISSLRIRFATESLHWSKTRNSYSVENTKLKNKIENLTNRLNQMRQNSSLAILSQQSCPKKNFFAIPKIQDDQKSVRSSFLKFIRSRLSFTSKSNSSNSRVYTYDPP